MIWTSGNKHVEISVIFVAFALLVPSVQPQALPRKCWKFKDTACTIRTNCAAYNRRIERGDHPMLRSCGWEDGVQYLCCPNNEVVTETTLVAVGPLENRFEIPKASDAKDACEKYKNVPNVNIDKIIAGEDAQKGEFPHMVALGAVPHNAVNEVTYGDCGGTLISKDYVLTAAHCTLRKTFSHVRMGKLHLNGNDGLKAVDRRVDTVIYFDEKNKVHDVALLKLDREVEFSDYVRPACLYTEPIEPREGIVIGWGTTNKDTHIAATKLQKGNISTVDNEECGKLLNTPVPEYKTCGLDKMNSWKKQIDTCQGDSGGPFMILENRDKNIYSVFGVTSNGIGCGGENIPGIYARVSYYVKWVEGIVWGTKHW